MQAVVQIRPLTTRKVEDQILAICQNVLGELRPNVARARCRRSRLDHNRVQSLGIAEPLQRGPGCRLSSGEDVFERQTATNQIRPGEDTA